MALLPEELRCPISLQFMYDPVIIAFGQNLRKNGVNILEVPPESLDLNYWRLAFNEFESTNSRSINSVNSCKLKGIKVVLLEERGTFEEIRKNRAKSVSTPERDIEQYLSLRESQGLL
ncbi:hypothetical protein AHAS_Ahas07G0042300 [Arachis hypogaea]